MSTRSYRDEYIKFHSSEKAKKDRAARNKARRHMLKAGRVRKEQDVDHRDGNPRNNSSKNLRAMSASRNRAKH